MSIVKEIKNRPQVLLPGNFSCTGCGLTVAYRMAISAVENPIVVIPACCASVIQGTAPKVTYTAPILNIAFAAHSAAASGVLHAKMARNEEATVMVWSGDGGSYDIGMATISGAAERNENISCSKPEEPNIGSWCWRVCNHRRWVGASYIPVRAEGGQGPEGWPGAARCCSNYGGVARP